MTEGNHVLVLETGYRTVPYTLQYSYSAFTDTKTQGRGRTRTSCTKGLIVPCLYCTGTRYLAVRTARSSPNLHQATASSSLVGPHPATSGRPASPPASGYSIGDANLHQLQQVGGGAAGTRRGRFVYHRLQQRHIRSADCISAAEPAPEPSAVSRWR